jgi:hypothetical protein
MRTGRQVRPPARRAGPRIEKASGNTIAAESRRPARSRIDRGDQESIAGVRLLSRTMSSGSRSVTSANAPSGARCTSRAPTIEP